MESIRARGRRFDSGQRRGGTPSTATSSSSRSRGSSELPREREERIKKKKEKEKAKRRDTDRRRRRSPIGRPSPTPPPRRKPSPKAGRDKNEPEERKREKKKEEKKKEIPEGTIPARRGTGEPDRDGLSVKMISFEKALEDEEALHARQLEKIKRLHEEAGEKCTRIDELQVRVEEFEENYKASRSSLSIMYNHFRELVALCRDLHYKLGQQGVLPEQEEQDY